MISLESYFPDSQGMSGVDSDHTHWIIEIEGLQFFFLKRERDSVNIRDDRLDEFGSLPSLEFYISEDL